MSLEKFLRKTGLFSKSFRKKGVQSNALRYAGEKREIEEMEKHQALWDELIAPNPKTKPWNRVSIGVHPDSSELSIDLGITPNIFLQGQPGSGKTVTHQTIINHCLSHIQRWEVIIIDLSHFREFSFLDTQYNARSLKMIQTKVDAITAIDRLYALFKMRTEKKSDSGEHVMVSIDNFEYMVKELTARNNNNSRFSHEFVSVEEGNEALSKLGMLIQFAGEYGIHFCIESNYDSTPSDIRRSIDKGRTKHLGFGKSPINRKIVGWDHPAPNGFGIEMDLKGADMTYFKGYLSESYKEYLSTSKIKPIDPTLL